jgi:hypothetical protein
LKARGVRLKDDKEPWRDALSADVNRNWPTSGFFDLLLLECHQLLQCGVHDHWRVGSQVQAGDSLLTHVKKSYFIRSMKIKNSVG